MGLTVLVVDDERDVRMATSALLSALGFKVQLAENGERSIELIREAPDRYDVVMLDASMPGLSGAETFAALRGIRGDLPILLCSGYDADDFGVANDERARFLAKPYRAAQLESAIAELTSGSATCSAPS